jgi:hypothetical protein
MQHASSISTGDDLATLGHGFVVILNNNARQFHTADDRPRRILQGIQSLPAGVETASAQHRLIVHFQPAPDAALGLIAELQPPIFL